MTTTTATAVLAFEPTTPFTPNFKYETVTLTKTEPRADEVLVRMLAVGICHTDIVVGSVPPGVYGTYPKVLGHEGSGYVEAVGSSVTSVKVGDPVLLSYTSCGSCDICHDERESRTYCQQFNDINIECKEQVWKDSDNKPLNGKFFGQSSFASKSIVSENSVVNVKGLIADEEELKKFSPLGCGLMTGSGSIINTAKATPNDVILVAGLGAVGLGAIMAAKIQGCRRIIAIDKIDSRLEVAKQLGATHIYNTSHLDPSKESYADEMAKELQALGDDNKVNFAIETTGFLPLINGLIKSLSKRGKLIAIGIPIPIPSPIIPFDFMDFFGGTKRMEVNYLGDANPQVYLPKLIQWYKEGKFPFDRFIKFYDAKDVAQALQDMKGDVIKPILLH